MTQLPLHSLRKEFPALLANYGDKNRIFFDGPGGTQMAKQALEAMVGYISTGMANLHGAFPTSVATDALLEEGRVAVADLLGCKPTEVAFGQNMTSLTFAIARGLGMLLQEGAEVVVTELDHRANVDPWVTMAKDKGGTARFIPVEPITCTLDLSELDHIITPDIKLVAVGLSSNVTGTVTAVETIVRRAKEVGALVVVDAVHAVPHMIVDFEALGCDILLCSAYKFFGPHLGIAVISAEVFEKLPVYKLVPAPATFPDKLETGTQNHEAIAGLVGAIDFIQSLGEGETRSERLRVAMCGIEEHERAQANELEEFLRSVPEVQLFRTPGQVRKTPTLAFTIAGIQARAATSWFAAHYNMCIADGHFYASTLADKLGVMDTGGWVRIGLAPYNTAEEVELFKSALLEFVEKHCRRIA